MKYPGLSRRVRVKVDPVRHAIVRGIIIDEDPGPTAAMRVRLRIEWVVSWGRGGESVWPASDFEAVDEVGGWVEITTGAETP